MNEILNLLKLYGVKKMELAHLVDMSQVIEDNGEDAMVVNTIEQDKNGTLVCYDNRNEDGYYQPLWNVSQLPKEIISELVFSMKFTMQDKVD